MNIAGRFSRVSRFEDDSFVLVGFCGNVWPHDLSSENIQYIKSFYLCAGDHKIFNEWPEGIEPIYPAAKKNFKNGFLLIQRN